MKNPRQKKINPGEFRPIVSIGKCEAKADCVTVCPFDVFEIVKISKADFKSLSFLERIKTRVHGMKVAETPHANQCMACGLCVKACPEDAITLAKYFSPSNTPIFSGDHK